jgi:hypothetical protein
LHGRQPELPGISQVWPLTIQNEPGTDAAMSAAAEGLLKQLAAAFRPKGRNC